MGSSSLGELFIALGFDVDDAKLKDFNQALKGTLNTMLEIAGVSVSIAGFAKLIDSASQTAASFREMTREIGTGTEQMQKFALAAHQVNPTVSVDQFRENYRNFAYKLLTDTEIYGSAGQAGPLALLTGRGVNRGETAESVFEAIQANMPNLRKQYSQANITDLLDKVGLGRNSRGFFDLAPSEVDKRTEGLLITDKEQKALADLAEKTATASEWIAKLGIVIAAFFATKAGQTLIGISGTSQAFSEGHGMDFLRKNLSFRDFVPGFIEKGADKLAGAMDNAVWEGSVNYDNRAKKFFRDRGWSAEDAAAIVSGLRSESGMNPNIYGKAKGERMGEIGEAYGLAQWHPARQAEFKKLKGYSIKDATYEDQLNFVNYELTHGYAKAALRMHAASSQDKFNVFKGEYEGAAGNWKTQNNTFNITSTDPRQAARQIQMVLGQQTMDAAANLPQTGH